MAIKLNLQLTKEQQQMVGLGLVMLGTAGFVYFKYFWMPVSKRISEAKMKIEEVEHKIDKAKTQAARLPRIQHELIVLNQQAADAEKRLPRNKDVPEVIETLSRLATRNRVALTSFVPGPASAKQFFTEIPYTISVTGAYHDIGRFFAAIALEERIFNVRSVAYTVAGPEARGAQPLMVNFVLVSYQYKG